MASGDSGHSSDDESVHNSSNEFNIDLISVGKQQQHPLPVAKKPKSFLSGAKKFLSRKKSGKQSHDRCKEFIDKNYSVPNYPIQDSSATHKRLQNPKTYESLNKGEIQGQSCNTYDENHRNEIILSTIVTNEFKNSFNYMDTKSKDDLISPTGRNSYGPSPNNTITPVNAVSHEILAQCNNFEAENFSRSLTDKQEINQMPGESCKPRSFHEGIKVSNSATMFTNYSSSNIHAHEPDSKEDILPCIQKSQQSDNESINPFSKEHNLESNNARRPGVKLSNIDKIINNGSNEDARTPMELITQSDGTSNHKNVNLVKMCPSSSAPLTQNFFVSESSLTSCQFDNLVYPDKRKKQPDAPSPARKLLKPATSVCPTQLRIGVNNLKDSVNEKNNSALELGEANPSVSTSLQNSSAVQNKLTDFERVLLKNPALENPDVENTISNQSVFISKEKLKNDNFDITKAQYYAYVLKSLPDDRLREVEKEISGILVHSQISAATGLDKSQAISMWHASNQLPSLSKKYLHGEPDIFYTKAQSYMNILRNLPKEKFEEVDRDISHILMQAQIAAWEKSQGNLNAEFRRKPLYKYVINKQSPSQKQGLPSPRKEKDASKFDKSPKKKHLYPQLHPEFNGDQNEQEYEDFSDGGLERATAHQENEEFIDDACEEEFVNEEMLYKPPKKTVTSTHHVQWRTSPRISKPHKDEAVPKPSTSYAFVKKIVYMLVVLCAIAAASFGAPYWPKILEKFSNTNPSPEPFANILQNLQNEFGEQPPMTFKVINIALRRVTKPNPEQPAIILLLAEQGAEDVAGRFARRIADSVSSTNVVVVSGHTYHTPQDHDEAKKEIDDLLIENLSTDRLKVVLVDRLDYIPPEVAIIFHTYCDHENASFKRVVYLMTIASTKTQLKSLTPKEWDIIAHEHLSEVWSKGGNDQISSLLSRLTVSVAAIVPGG